MSEYDFTLIVEGTYFDDDETVNAVYEAGCDDATVGYSNGIPLAGFTREAESLEAAILSAIRDLESVDGVRVVRVDDTGLVSMADIAERTGRTRESVRLLVEGKRGPGGFPAPATNPFRRHRLWRWLEVDRWFEASIKGHQLDEQGHAVAAINAWLELRRLRPTVAPERWEAFRALLAS